MLYLHQWLIVSVMVVVPLGSVIFYYGGLVVRVRALEERLEGVERNLELILKKLLIREG